MANVPGRRMQEMEEEMNRFEEELMNTVDDGGRQFQPPHGPGPMSHPLVPPPPPPPAMGINIARPFNMIPSFIPPQLRARQMMIPPRPPPMHLRPMPPNIPNGFQPPPVPPMLNRVPPPNSFNFNPANKPEETQYNPKITATPTVIAASKVIYSAPPVKNISNKKTADVARQPATTAITTTPTVSQPIVAANIANNTNCNNNSASKNDTAASKKKEVDEIVGGGPSSAKVAKVDSLIKPPINNSKIMLNLQPKDSDGNKKLSSSSSSSSSSATPRPAAKQSMPTFTPVKSSSSGNSAVPSTSAASKPPSSSSTSGSKDKKDKKDKKKKYVRMAAGNVWEDLSLNEWDPDDFRLFCGDLGNEVTDDVLNRVFSKYPSFQKARVIRDKRTNKTKGYGFASFKDPTDFMKAIRDLNGKYVGNRPIKLKKSCWQDRQYENMKKKEREKKRLGFR